MNWLKQPNHLREVHSASPNPITMQDYRLLVIPPLDFLYHALSSISVNSERDRDLLQALDVCLQELETSGDLSEQELSDLV